MILAGIDEAGYGPLLGPLVVGMAAVRIPQRMPSGPHGIPDLWRMVPSLFSRTKSVTGKKLHIGDSKKVYSPSKGLGPLEEGVLTLLGLMASHPALLATLDDVLAAGAPDSVADIAALPWYQPVAGEVFPLECDATALRMRANAGRHALHERGVEWTAFKAFVVTEAVYNAIVEKTRNKASASFQFVARHIDALVRQADADGVWIVCDRQGGRTHYGELLRMMFDGWDLTIESEETSAAHYLLRRGDACARISFAEKGESASLPTAAASMLCKYLREACMHRFNRWWGRQQSGLTPTAGYYTDGMRWLADTEELRRRLGVPDATLVRSR